MKKNVQNRFRKCAAYKETKKDLKNDYSHQRFRELKNSWKRKAKYTLKKHFEKGGPGKACKHAGSGMAMGRKPRACAVSVKTPYKFVKQEFSE